MSLTCTKALPRASAVAAAALVVAAPALHAQQAPQTTQAQQAPQAASAAMTSQTAATASASEPTQNAPATQAAHRTLVAQAQAPQEQVAQAQVAQAQAPAAPATAEEAPLQEVIVTGTRQLGIEAVQSPAPIQIISGEALQQTASIPNLQNVLAVAIPSFTTQVTGGDMSGLTLQAKIDGLSPNEVLVLVNGKRRNTTANIGVDASPYTGGAGVDLSLIPLDAIDHVEVLQDGAAAQYGTDAIAGVINLILKSNNTGAYVYGTDGGYYDGGGRSSQVSGNFGFSFLDDGYLNFTAQISNHGHSLRAFPDLRSVVSICPSSNDICSFPNSNMTQVANWPYINPGTGDGEQHLKLVTSNAGYKFDNGIELYSTTTYSNKWADTYENYRLPNKVHYVDQTTGETIYPAPYGFQPQEQLNEDDFEQTTGIKGTLGTWHWDLSSGFGGDRDLIYTTYTYNAGTVAYYGDTLAQLQAINPSYTLADESPPVITNYYDGRLGTTQWVTTLDVDNDFNVGLSNPLNVALGTAYRRDTYSISPGVYQSYALGGGQSFSGWSPTDSGSHERKNIAGYVDLATKPIDALRIDLAGRYEHYSDFGSATVGKLTARYDFSPQFALRGTANNGFRAPTLAEEYFSLTNVAPTSATVSLPPNSAAGKIVGLGSGLQPEKSVNYSFGAVFRPIPRLNITADVYQILVTNRIVESGTIDGTRNGVVVLPLINQAIAANGNQLDPDVVKSGTTAIQIFTNGIDTRTRGASFTLDYPVNYGEAGNVDYSIAYSYNLTSITAIYPNPAALGTTPLFDATSKSYLTTANPAWVTNVGVVWSLNKFTFNLLEKIYGPVSTWNNDGGDNPTNNNEYFLSTTGVTPITNLTLSYQVDKHLLLAIGAQNLFNKIPGLENPTLVSHVTNPIYVAADGSTGVNLYGPGALVYGDNGGYYFASGKYTF